jgi:hypothetical protein
MKEDTVLEYPAYVAKELEFSTTIRKEDRGIRVRRVQEWLDSYRVQFFGRRSGVRHNRRQHQ